MSGDNGHDLEGADGKNQEDAKEKEKNYIEMKTRNSGKCENFRYMSIG
jgi:hypothetical protein